jgi:hypothetical protein
VTKEPVKKVHFTATAETDRNLAAIAAHLGRVGKAAPTRSAAIAYSAHLARLALDQLAEATHHGHK